MNKPQRLRAEGSSNTTLSTQQRDLGTSNIFTNNTELMLELQTFGAVPPSQNTYSYHQGSGNYFCGTQMPLQDGPTKKACKKPKL